MEIKLHMDLYLEKVLLIVFIEFILWILVLIILLPIIISFINL